MSCRVAARWPASAARWSDAWSERPIACEVNQPTRNPASNASPAPVVSVAVIGVVATSSRSCRSPSRARTVAPFDPRFTTAIVANGPMATRACKQLVRDVAGREIDAALRADTARRIADIRASDEGREGIQSFLGKRKPNWLL